MNKQKKEKETKRLRKMKLFVWEDVLTDYTSGMVCILAETLEQAFDMLFKKDSIAWSKLMGLWDLKSWNDSDIKELENKFPDDDLTELQMKWLKQNNIRIFKNYIEPQVVDYPAVFVVHGGG